MATTAPGEEEVPVWLLLWSRTTGWAPAFALKTSNSTSSIRKGPVSLPTTKRIASWKRAPPPTTGVGAGGAAVEIRQKGDSGRLGRGGSGEGEQGDDERASPEAGATGAVTDGAAVPC